MPGQIFFVTEAFIMRSGKNNVLFDDMYCKFLLFFLFLPGILIEMSRTTLNL